jgi:uncharacterized membrane protein YdbT with pleckstrin-like domain
MNLLSLIDQSPASIYQFLLPHERSVITVRMHPAKLLGPLSLSLAGFAAAGLVTTGVIHGGAAVLSITWATCLILLLYFLVQVAAWSVMNLVVTNTRMIFITGLLVRKMSMIPLRQITDMDLKRSNPGRLLGYGTFLVELAGKDQVQRKMNYMPYPEQIFLELAELMFPANEEEDAPEPEPGEFR